MARASIGAAIRAGGQPAPAPAAASPAPAGKGKPRPQTRGKRGMKGVKRPKLAAYIPS